MLAGITLNVVAASPLERWLALSHVHHNWHSAVAPMWLQGPGTDREPVLGVIEVVRTDRATSREEPWFLQVWFNKSKNLLSLPQPLSWLELVCQEGQPHRMASRSCLCSLMSQAMQAHGSCIQLWWLRLYNTCICGFIAMFSTWLNGRTPFLFYFWPSSLTCSLACLHCSLRLISDCRGCIV